jgi:hypothetical protein
MANMRHDDERFRGHQLQHELAVWMLRRGARTHTIMKWTSLPRSRIQALSKTYLPEDGDQRRRGISPYQPSYFVSSLILESETAALISILMKVGVIPEAPLANARKVWPSTARGEKLMMCFDLYQKSLPDHQISIERVVLLIFELVETRSLYLRPCNTCPLFMVVETLGPQHDQCAECRDRRARLAASSASCEPEVTA